MNRRPTLRDWIGGIRLWYTHVAAAANTRRQDAPGRPFSWFRLVLVILAIVALFALMDYWPGYE